MAKAKLAWWVIPSVITGSVAALGAVGTLIIGSAAWLTLPDKVKAGEQKNVQQDAQLQELKVINETWQKIYQQQQAQPPASVPVPAVRLPEPEPPAPLREWDEQAQTFWCCKASAEWRQWCFDYDQWYRCE